MGEIGVVLLVSQKQMSKEARFHICVAAARPGCGGLSTYHRVSDVQL